jgi:hypothetical protein
MRSEVLFGFLIPLLFIYGIGGGILLCGAYLFFGCTIFGVGIMLRKLWNGIWDLDAEGVPIREELNKREGSPRFFPALDLSQGGITSGSPSMGFGEILQNGLRTPGSVSSRVSVHPVVLRHDLLPRKFDREMDAFVFLEQCQDYMFRHNLSAEEFMLHLLPGLLDEETYVWFKFRQPVVGTDWNRFKSEFLAGQIPAGYRHRLWKDVLTRTQGQGESVDSFCAQFCVLLDRYDPFMAAETKIDFLRQNMLPQYRVALAGRRFSTVDHLLTALREIQEAVLSFGGRAVLPAPERNVNSCVTRDGDRAFNQDRTFDREFAAPVEGNNRF